MTVFKICFYLVLSFFLAWLFFKCRVTFSYIDFKDYLMILFAVSSMVFTLMGIWIAFLYPNALQKLMQPETIVPADFSDVLSETKRLEGLVGSVLKSAFVVIMILVIFLSKILFSNTNIYIDNIELLKSVSLSSVIVLSLLQLESIVYVMYSNVMFINELHSKRENKVADSDI